MAAPPIFDKRLLRARCRRARALGAATFLLDQVAGDFADRLAATPRRFDLAADLGTPTAAVRMALSRTGAVGRIIAASPLPELAEELEPPDFAPLRVVADEEALPFAPASLDLVVSALALQTVNDLPGVLVQVRRCLKPEGRLIAALLGGDTLTELRESFAAAECELEGGASPRISPFAGPREMGALLQRAGFERPVTDSDHITVRYGAPLDLLHDLRRMGATNPLIERSRIPLRRATLLRALAIYAERFSDPDGKVRASFEVVWLSGWSVPAAPESRHGAAGMMTRGLTD